jgi:hypothetical protein
MVRKRPKCQQFRRGSPLELTFQGSITVEECRAAQIRASHKGSASLEVHAGHDSRTRSNQTDGDHILGPTNEGAAAEFGSHPNDTSFVQLVRGTGGWMMEKEPAASLLLETETYERQY